MNLTGFFIDRPVLTTLLALGALFFGILAYLSLPVSFLPAVEFPTIQVSASLSGASPQTMANSVAAPLEREFSTIAGLSSMSSTNSQSSSSITLQFDLSRSIDDAAMDVEAAISRARGNLPDTMTTPPSFNKTNPADQPILYFTMRSDTLPLSLVNDYAKTIVSQNLSTVNGVSKVEIYGEQRYAVRVRLDPGELATRGLGVNEVRAAVAAANVNLPLGTLEGDLRSLTLQAEGQLFRAKEYRSIIVTQREGKPVRLADLALVEDGVQAERFSAWTNGQKTLLLAVKRQPGSNTIQVARDIQTRLETVRAQLPASVRFETIYDQSLFIEDAVQDVKFTLVLAVALVVVVVFVFLRNLAGTFIASVAIPFSIILTFAAMYLLGYTVDTLSLMALTLSVGFVVDDAIVMLENIVRHLEAGKTPLQAARDGAKEIGFTIVSMTLSLAVVFVPILFMAGTLGRIMHEFAQVITLAILLSGVISLSLTPMLGSRMLRSSSRLAESDPIFGFLLRGYERSLRLALRHRLTTMLVAVLLLAATVQLFVVIPKGFLPANDMDYFYGFAQAREGIPYKRMKELQLQLDPLFAADPDVRYNCQIVGNPLQNQGMIVALLKPRAERKRSVDAMIREYEERANTIPGLMAFLLNPPLFDIGGKSGKGDYMFTMLCADTGLLYAEALKFQGELAGLPQLRNVTSDLLIGNPELNVAIDRDMAALYGVSAADIEDALYTAYGQREISTIYSAKDEYKVIMELKPEFQIGPGALSMLYVRTGAGRLVRLDTVIRVNERSGPTTVNHSGQLPSVTFSFNAAPGVALGELTRVVDALALEKLPDTIQTMFEGTAGAFAQSLTSLYVLLGLAILVIYIILGCLYESFLHPVTILSGLPSAALGGLLTLTVFNLDLDLYGFVGIIMLIGIVKKNAIMVVDFAVAEQRKGLAPAEAACQGAMVRLRPILMTTLAAIMGALPIAIGFGASADARRPLGLVVVGGLLLSQVVTLYLTPVFYSYMEQLREWLGRSSARVAEGPPANEGVGS